MSEARSRLAAMAAGDHLGVAEAALWIAAEEYPGLDVAAYLLRFDALAAEVRDQVRAAAEPAERVARLNQFLFVEHGFVGNSENYYDPRNSFLNDVLDRRAGLPITLSIVYCEVAQRLDLPMCGVGFPGHFLVKHAAEPEILVDPFSGSVISVEDCVERLRRLYGREIRFDRRLLRGASDREIVARILANLKQVYLRQQDLVRALACVDRILLFRPDDARELRDRGVLYQRLECFAAAARDLQRYLDLAPADPGAEAVRAMLPMIQRQAASLQ
jgi:regulator of sirC expression with transglutaminase-like and TPR domain